MSCESDEDAGRSDEASGTDPRRLRGVRPTAWVLALLTLSAATVRSGAHSVASEAGPTLERNGALQETVESRFTGRITVSSEVDPSGDYGGFHVVVGSETETSIDTIGRAVTDSSGAFDMTVRAPGRGIYSVFISRNDQLLTMGDLAVADGDTARLSVTFPRQGRWLSVRSPENASWLAFKNLRVQHSRSLSRLVSDTVDVRLDSIALAVERSADMMWRLRETFPGTIGAEFAAAESIVMLEGWNDSLALERADAVAPENPRYVEVGRVGRRATARLRGQAAALEVLARYEQRALTDEERAALVAERVRTHLDSLEQEEAVEAARELASNFPSSRWAPWAERAEYEANNLLPGMDAPGLTATAVDGRRVSLDSLRGRTVVVEFWAPQSQVYRRQLAQINQLYEQISPQDVAWVAVSLESDPQMDAAFREDRSLPGLQVRADSAQAAELVRRFNVMSVPTRYVIGPNGRIDQKYAGGSLAALRADLLRRFQSTSADTTQPPTP